MNHFFTAGSYGPDENQNCQWSTDLSQDKGSIQKMWGQLWSKGEQKIMRVRILWVSEVHEQKYGKRDPEASQMIILRNNL